MPGRLRLVGSCDDWQMVDTDSEELLATVNQIMPFGRFKGRRLIELPEPYLVWFHREGFPSGLLGRRMAVMYEIKLNGLEQMLKPLIRNAEGSNTEASS